MKHYYKPNQKRSNIKDFDINSKKVDVRPLDQRSGKRIKPNQQPDATEKLIFDNDILLPACEDNPIELRPLNPPNKFNSDEDSLQPDYVKHRAKYGYEVL